MEGKLATARPFGYQLDVRYHPYNLRYLALLRHLKLKLQLQLQVQIQLKIQLKIQLQLEPESSAYTYLYLPRYNTYSKYP